MTFPNLNCLNLIFFHEIRDIWTNSTFSWFIQSAFKIYQKIDSNSIGSNIFDQFRAQWANETKEIFLFVFAKIGQT